MNSYKLLPSILGLVLLCSGCKTSSFIELGPNPFIPNSIPQILQDTSGTMGDYMSMLPMI